MVESVEKRYGAFSRPSFFSRVDNTHPLELHIGLDDKGRKSIELRSVFTPKKITGTSAIEVNQYKKDAYNTLRFSLCDGEMSGLFFKFCDDLIEQSRNIIDVSTGYQTIVNRFFQWKKMFVSSKNSLLTEPEIMGLIGEILFLRGELTARIGLSRALKSWSGQELTHKDFSYEGLWFEVKTIYFGAQTVKISSLEQLDSDKDGELIVYSLEKMSAAYSGVALNKLVIETRNLFTHSEERDSFMTKVALQGYEYNDYYDDFVYEIGSCNRYNVTQMFPKLTRQTLPAAIIKASYELSLQEIAIYEIK